MQKEYVVVVKKGLDISDLDTQLASSTGDSTIPSRIVECVNPMHTTSRLTHWMLTDEEAKALESDERVLAVEIPFEDRDDIGLVKNARQSSTFNKSGTSSGVNWGLSRCTSEANNFTDGVTELASTYLYSLDGTGVDVVIMDSGIQADHPEFTDAAGVSRIKQVDWYSEANGVIAGTQSASFYTDTDGHGTFCSGIAAGKTMGWAKNADIYIMKIFDTGAIGVSDGLDLIKEWHKNKTNNRPTVVNMSFGYGYTNVPVPSAGDSGLHYNEVTGLMDAWTYGDVGYTSSQDIFYKVNANYTPIDMPVRMALIDARIDDMITEGIHIVVAAGNAQTVGSEETDGHYNDSITIGGSVKYYHRSSSPRTTGDGGVEIVVGAIDSDLTSNKDAVADYSNRGVTVDILAPGSDIVSTVSTSNDGYTTGDYPEDSNFKISSANGTSFAAPQVVGMSAIYLSRYPLLTPAELKVKIINDSKKDIVYEAAAGYDEGVNPYLNTYNGGLYGTPNRMLYNRFSGDMLVAWS